MSENKRSMIRGHEPLRVPSNWKSEDRAFVVQLERVLDDIYSRFGRIGLKDLSPEIQDKIDIIEPVYNGLDKVDAGYALDARQGKTLNDNFTNLQMRYLNKTGDDLNNLYNTSDTGFYITGASTTNSPASYSALIVVARNGICYQTVVSTTDIYKRSRTGSPLAWSAWTKIVSNYFEHDKQYAVVSEAYGYVTSSSTTMYVDVVLAKAFDRAPTITRLDIIARGTNGYIDVFTEAKNVFSQSGFSVSCALRNERLLRIEIKKTTALTNVTNNTPVILVVSNLTFTA